MFKFGIVVARDIENILHFKKINEEWLLYKWYKSMIIYFMHFTMYFMAYVCIL
jgi:myo-inositol-hexaphosphate 3-phosphohydrolase